MITLIKLSPMIVLAGLMMSGMDILLAAPIAFIVATIVAMLLDRFSFSALLRTGYRLCVQLELRQRRNDDAADT